MSIFQEPKISKSILYEFAIKSKIEVPAYKTTCAEEAEPVFVSTCTFNGKSYTSEIAGSKKMAEQLAARKAIQSNLGNNRSQVFVFTYIFLNDFLLTYRMRVKVFDSDNVLSQIIKSKTKPHWAQGIMPTAVEAGKSAHLYNILMILSVLFFCLD